MQLFDIHFPISKKFHKYFELESQINKEFWELFKIFIHWSRKTDHAGINIHLSIMWWFIDFNIYDNRHWNDDENRFFKDGEPQF